MLVLGLMWDNYHSDLVVVVGMFVELECAEVWFLVLTESLWDNYH